MEKKKRRLLAEETPKKEDDRPRCRQKKKRSKDCGSGLEKRRRGEVVHLQGMARLKTTEGLSRC